MNVKEIHWSAIDWEWLCHVIANIASLSLSLIQYSSRLTPIIGGLNQFFFGDPVANRNLSNFEIDILNKVKTTFQLCFNEREIGTQKGVSLSLWHKMHSSSK